MALKGTTGLRELFRLYKIFIIPIASIASESQLRLYNYFFFTIKNALKGINFRSCRKRSC